MKQLLFLLLLALSLSAFASEDGALSLSPAVVMLRGEHGQSTTQTLLLTNGTSRTFTFDLVAQDVVVRDGKREFVNPGSIAGSIAATAVFSQKKVEVPPGQSVAVKMTVTLPATTSQRAVVALFRGTNRVMSGNVPMLASLGTLLTFTTTDSVALTATPLHVQPQSATANLAAAQDLTNTGTEPLVAKGVLAVVDAKGALVGRTETKPWRVLPGESARLGAEFPGELDPGRYRVMVTYDYEGRPLMSSAEVEVE
jgi:hypothetical protein